MNISHRDDNDSRKYRLPGEKGRSDCILNEFPENE